VLCLKPYCPPVDRDAKWTWPLARLPCTSKNGRMAEHMRPFDLGFSIEESWIVEMSYADAVVTATRYGELLVSWQTTTGQWKHPGSEQPGLEIDEGPLPQTSSTRCLKLWLEYHSPADQVKALFVETLAFRWQEAGDRTSQGYGAFEVIDSAWLAAHERQGALTPGIAPPFRHGGLSSYRHLRLDFDMATRQALGLLEVLCRGVLVQPLDERGWTPAP